MKQIVLFAILDQFADWEPAFLASCLNNGIEEIESNYIVKTLSTSLNPVTSIGGFTVLPDYDVTNYPKDFAALILVGGNSWRTEEAMKLVPVIQEAQDREILLGSICDSTVFLGKNKFLNDKRHTSNLLPELKEVAGEHYTGEANYINEQSVVDGRLITANGTGFLEFTRDVLTQMEAFPQEYIDTYYEINKLGFVPWVQQQQG